MQPDVDLAVLLDEAVEIEGRLPKGRNAQHGGAPIRDLGEVVDEVAKSRLDLIEGADHHHHFAEAQAPGEIAGRSGKDRNDDREPAISGGDPGEAGESPERRRVAVRTAATNSSRLRRSSISPE